MVIFDRSAGRFSYLGKRAWLVRGGILLIAIAVVVGSWVYDGRPSQPRRQATPGKYAGQWVNVRLYQGGTFAVDGETAGIMAIHSALKAAGEKPVMPLVSIEAHAQAEARGVLYIASLARLFGLTDLRLVTVERDDLIIEQPQLQPGDFLGAPVSETGKADPRVARTFMVNASGHVYVDDEAPKLVETLKALSEEIAAHPDRIVLVRVAGACPVQGLVSVISDLHNAGVRRVALQPLASAEKLLLFEQANVGDATVAKLVSDPPGEKRYTFPAVVVAGDRSGLTTTNIGKQGDVLDILVDRWGEELVPVEPRVITSGLARIEPGFAAEGRLHVAGWYVLGPLAEGQGVPPVLPVQLGQVYTTDGVTRLGWEYVQSRTPRLPGTRAEADGDLLAIALIHSQEARQAALWVNAGVKALWWNGVAATRHDRQSPADDRGRPDDRGYAVWIEPGFNCIAVRYGAATTDPPARLTWEVGEAK